MTNSKRISTDVSRSILQHLMFGALAVLILLNWSVHRPMDYGEFNYSLDNSNKTIEARTKIIQSYLKDEFEEDVIKFKPGQYQKLQTIISETSLLLESIDKLDSMIKIGKYNFAGVKEMQLGDSLIKITIKYFYRVTNLISLDSNHRIIKILPLNKESLQVYMSLLTDKSIAVDYHTKWMIEGAIKSLKNDIIITENLMVYYLYEEIRDRGIYCKFFKAIAIPESGYYITGQKIITLLTIADYEMFSVKKSGLTIDFGKINRYEQGIFYWENKAQQLGMNTVSGNIEVKNRREEIQEPFTFSYFVSAAGIALHVDKANVVYAGVPNPLSINVPGYAADKIKLRVAGANVSKTEDGKFEIFFNKIPPDKVYAYVDATNAQGRASTVHSIELKVQNLPAPVSNFEIFKEDGIDAELFRSYLGLNLSSADTAFDIDYSVVSFQVEMISADNKYSGPIKVIGGDFIYSPDLKNLIDNTSAGDRFIFSEIVGKSANGEKQKALPFSLLIK